MKAILKSANLSHSAVDEATGVISGCKLFEVGGTATYKGRDGKVRSFERTVEVARALLAHAGNRSIPAHFTHDYDTNGETLPHRLGLHKNLRIDEATGNLLSDLHTMPNEYGKLALWTAKTDPNSAAFSAVFGYNPITADGKTLAIPTSFDAADFVSSGAACAAMLASAGGEWKTINGRKIFIKEGQSLDEAMKEGGIEKDDEIYQKDNIDVSDDTKDLPEGHKLAQDGGLWTVKDKDGKLISAAASRAGALQQAKNPPKARTAKGRKTAHDKAIDKLQSSVNKARLSYAGLVATLSAFTEENSMTKEEIESLFDERIEAALSKFTPKAPENLITKEGVDAAVKAALSAHKATLDEDAKKEVAMLSKAAATEFIGTQNFVRSTGGEKATEHAFLSKVSAQKATGATEDIAFLRAQKDNPELFNDYQKSRGIFKN